MASDVVVTYPEPPAEGSTSATADELHGFYVEDLEVGMTAVYAKTVSETDIVLFAGISGDNNPVHLNQEFAADTVFEGRIAHGMLTAAFISTVLGMKLPGPGCVYLSQSLNFKAPVRAGDTVTARVTLKELNVQRRRAVFETVCTVGDTVVVDGEALISVPRRPKGH